MVSFHSFPWEQKGLRYYIKDTIRNRPQMMFCAAAYVLVFGPILYHLWVNDEARSENYSRFRPKYIVYRDDDPRVRNVIRYDENGNRIHLEPKTK